PLRVRRLPIEHRVPPTRPLELAGEPRPERLRIALGIGVNALVLDDRPCAKLGRRRERPVFTKEIAELSGALGIGHAAKNTLIRASAAKALRDVDPPGAATRDDGSYDEDGMSMTPGGVSFLKIIAPRTPPIVEKTAPTNSPKTSATIRPRIMNPKPNSPLRPE